MFLLSAPSSFSGIVHRLALWILLAFLCSAIIRFMLMIDINKRVYNHSPGPCRIVNGIANGSAGLEIIPSDGLVFITSGLAKEKGIRNVKSGISVYEVVEQNPNSPIVHNVKEVTIENFDMAEFAPFGISSYVSKGRTTLYVVNRRRQPNCVEIFTFNRQKLTAVHRKSVCDERFTSLLDIAVVGADRFYITNTAYFGPGWMQTAELAMQSLLGSLFLFDGHSLSLALPSLPSPTGLALDNKRNLLFVGSLLSESIKVFTVSADLSLSHKTEISLLSSPVGIHIDEPTGEIWAAMLPVVYNTFFHVNDPADKRLRAPSQVLRIRIQEDGTSWVVTEPYANDGATLSASSSVVYLKDQLLIGSLFGRLLHCDVLNPQIT